MRFSVSIKRKGSNDDVLKAAWCGDFIDYISALISYFSGDIRHVCLVL